jgi:iron complex outermembrane receptor protein
MSYRLAAGLLGASVFALATAAYAQPAPPASAPAAAPADEATLGEIVVTARRRAESLQEVPQTVNAVTADTLQKLQVKQFTDIQTVVPGLSLAGSANGFTNAASLRGVTFDVTTGAQPTVALYLNDAPVQANTLFHSMFDIGQVEILKGPQGTTRGISAPSGAITVTTHKPDLSSFGGYVDGTLTDLQARNIQGAINAPIIKDVLAVRVGAVLDQNRLDGITSIHSSARPRSVTSSERVSVSFEPSDVFNANLTYQHIDQHITSFQQVSGPGQGAFTIGGVTYPASTNPALTPDQRVSVEDRPGDTRTKTEVLTGQIDSRIFGQHLSYVGSFQHQIIHTFSVTGGAQGGDAGNLLPGIEIPSDTYTTFLETTQELRLASDPAPGRFFDYTVGAFYNWANPGGHVNQPGPATPGAFGPTPAVNLGLYNPAFQVPIAIDIPSSLQETSLFGSVTLHLPYDTELSGGIRHIWSVTNSSTVITTENALLSLTALGLPASIPCAALPGLATGPSPGVCVIPGGAPGNAGNLSARSSETPNIYNLSLSHHFTRDFLVYVNSGTAYRPPVASVGIQGALANATNPVLRTLSFHPSERSRSYEIGFKSTWFDGRARLNASVFRQRFSNLTIFIPGIQFLNTVSTPASVGSFDFTQSVDALVQGFDIDTALQITHDWNVSLQASYADGKVQGSLVPCNTFNAAGQPSFNTKDPRSGLALISMCPGGSSSRLPLWNATLQTEYTHPVADNMDGFIRGLVTYYPENKNRAEPDFTVPNYSLVNLYLGVRSHDGAWEASLFARNAFNSEHALDIEQIQQNLNTVLGQFFPQLIRPTGYYRTLMTPQREVGINVHYAWGSR